MNLAEIDSIVAASKKRCPACRTDKPLSSFASNSARADGLQTACRSCRSALKRAGRSEARAERAAATPRPAGRGPERLEPGAILVALEELGASDEPLVTLDSELSDVPRELRARAVVAPNGRVVIQRVVLIDWVRAQRRRVGEHAMRTIGKSDLEVRDVRSEDVATAAKRQSEDPWH